jgi:hypothetical protein
MSEESFRREVKVHLSLSVRERRKEKFNIRRDI